jgi:F-type H+-transporting ATPase subunit b
VKGNRKYLDDFAVEFLNDHRQDRPIIVADTSRDEQIAAAEAENKNLLINIAELQERLLVTQTSLIEAKKLRLEAAAIEEARKEQARILKEAAASRDMIVEQAKVQAQDEATKIMDHARTQIAADKESALRDIRKEVALLSVSVAEKVLKKDLEDSGSQTELVNRLVDEIGKE